MQVRNLVVGIAVAAVMVGCATPRQMIFDTEVDRLCVTEGGVRVYETVPTSRAQLRSDGYPAAWDFSKGEYALGPDYKVIFETQVLKGATSADEGAQIVKYVFEVYRRADNRLLGVDYSFARKGGDAIQLHPSSHSCPPVTQDVVKSIFKVKD